MASSDQVRRYLAYWFQLGKPVVLNNGETQVLPQPVIQGDRYSPEFETCWQRITAHGGRDCYLEGTIQTIEELLSPVWEIDPCARCEMPVPVISLGFHSFPCPCFDLPSWPNSDLPKPRSPVDSHAKLDQIRSRLMNRNPSTPRPSKPSLPDAQNPPSAKFPLSNTQNIKSDSP